MNARVIELLKNPELFQTQDLELLAGEIKKQPYIQNIRALQLYGIHRFSPDEYQNSLSTTAAYTTDKKILYQFINKTSVEKTVPAEPAAITAKAEPAKKVFAQVETIQREEPKPVFVDGALNRILFEGEEDFLTQKNEVIDLESTMESGQIVTQTPQPKSEEITADVVNRILDTEPSTENITVDDLETEQKKIEPENSRPVSTEVSEEKQTYESEPAAIIQDENSLISDVEENAADINFHGTQEFLSEVKIVPPTLETPSYEVPKPQLNKHEIEMQRLIAEVEAKMKSRKKPQSEKKEEEIQNTDLNFADTQSFVVSEPEATITVEKSHENKSRFPTEKVSETPQKQTHTEPLQEEESSYAGHPAWKPMSFAGNIPDALIGREKPKEETKLIPAVDETQQTGTLSEITSEEKTEERPVFNVSFFTQNVSPIESEPVEQNVSEEKKEEEVKPQESNVPTFINTWQNWLKIDRSGTDLTQNTSLSKTEVKNTVIENFIVKEPKISKLKEESDFVVKEKSDNISHLMTETLAKLYVEQKLYSKAIKAYQILSEKHPGRKPHFDEQISNIKELRQNK